MSIFEKIKSFSIDKNKEQQFGVKSAIVWGNSNNSTFPILYLSKPRHISEEEFRELIDAISIEFVKQEK